METNPQRQRIQNWEETLREEGFRLTEVRRVVIKVLTESETALSAQEIYDQARENGHSLGIASVYRTLEVLTDLGLIQQIHQPQGCQAYWPAVTGHKHYMICTKCGRIVTFVGQEDLKGLFQEVEENSGYQVQDHWLQLFGICQDCQS